MSRLSSPTFRIRNIPSQAQPHTLASFLAREIPATGPAKDVQILSLAYSWSYTRKSETKVATVRFASLPQVFNDGAAEWLLRATFDGVSCNITIDIHFQDFTVFNNPDWEGCEDDFADCIAIPGLCAHAFNSWVHPSSPDYNWLRDKLPESLPRVRCILYGYDSKLGDLKTYRGIDDLARSLKHQLRFSQHPSGARPMCFVAHSVGGVALKRVLLMLANGDGMDRAILSSVRCVLFLGVPNKGVPHDRASAMINFNVSPVIYDELSNKSKCLQDLDDEFCRHPLLRHIRIFSFFEMRPTALSTQLEDGSWQYDGREDILVDMDCAIHAASRTLGSDYHGLDKSHANLIVFPQSDLSFNLLHSTMYQCCEEAGISVSQPLRKYSFPEEKVAGKDSSFDSSLEALAADWSTISSQRSHESIPQWNRLLSNGEDLWDGANESIQAEKTRFSKIRNPLGSSCLWAHKNSELGYQDWLDRGTGLYHIQGAPGTGKSVLMKYLVMSTHSLARPDEQVTDTIITSYFFERKGDAEHKTMDAFRQSILCQLLMVEPKLRPLLESIIPAEYTFQKSWNSLRLSQGMARLVTQKMLPIRIVIFIDAIDDCQGEPEDVCNSIRDLVETSRQSATRLSICMSSRRVTVVQQCLRDVAGFAMEENTKYFLKIYVQERLKHLKPNYKAPKDDGGFFPGRGVMGSGPRKTGDYYELVERVLERAQGSYEWTRNAIPVLFREAVDKTDTKELLGIVRDLPGNLDELSRLRVSYR